VESDVVSITVEENEKGIIPQNPTTGEELNKPGECDATLDLPIALRKGTKSCTRYPMYSFLSYNNLSSKFRAFTGSFDTVTIPKNIYVAMEIHEWKVAVMEE
ncbi:hypothetical protein, partial [Picosynechococcus sp. PCC 7002]|uniref:hypothetical protein n=1 Tax=Picosynechococcus sp. (strain ATCC 27264 / PCC 7002 / PR-6) TaxID=32049 RepID=UPI001C3CE720